MAFDREFAAKICSSTASPDAAALLVEALAALAEALVVLADALALPDAAELAAEELEPDEQPTSANAATRATAHIAVKTNLSFFMYVPSFHMVPSRRTALFSRRRTIF